MTTHYDDEAQVEQLRAWWKENWLALVAGLVIGLAAIFGWEGWQHHKEKRAADASQMYEELKDALSANKTDVAKPLADKLTAEFADTPYAADAELRVAAQAEQAGNYEDAAKALQWVRDHAKDKGLQQVATLRSARILWQQGKLDDALKLAEANKSEAFAPLFDELTGDIKLAKGDRKAARSDYQKAYDATPEDQPSRQLLQRKLDDLSETEPS
ncbi:YfgM family protein [Solimonas marina]|uniref:Ancillary SecYEG translocon subunit n=1 Tax=Solimonas marina TaxID=2714601 RepID=A0A969WC82_9GAMM|nr:tetratricopeptide repeat protein [Solimonas marina]